MPCHETLLWTVHQFVRKVPEKCGISNNVADFFMPKGGISERELLILFGIHSTKYAEFLFRMWSMWSWIACGHIAAVICSDSQLATMERIANCHPTFRVDHSLNELRNTGESILLWSWCAPRSKSYHEERKSGKRNQICCQLAQVSISCPGKRKVHVIPYMTADMSWLRSLYLRLLIFKVSKHLL